MKSHQPTGASTAFAQTKPSSTRHSFLKASFWLLLLASQLFTACTEPFQTLNWNLPAAVNSGVFYSFYARIRNTHVAAKNMDVSVVLSYDGFKDQNDWALASKNTGDVAPGGTFDMDLPFQIPAGLHTGTYYLIAYVNEQQFVQRITLTGLAANGTDLVCENMVFDNSVISDESFGVHFTLENRGNQQTPSSQTRLYISTDDVFSPATDLLLAAPTTSSIAAKSRSEQYIPIAIPDHLVPDKYTNMTLFTVADASNKTSEFNETNNVHRTTLSVRKSLPEINVQNLKAPNGVVTGGAMIFEAQFLNSGKRDAGSFSYSMYLSTDGNPSADDVFLDDFWVSGLAKNQLLPVVDFLKIPDNLPAGAYFLLLVADEANVVPEHYEQNIAQKQIFIINLLQPGAGLTAAAAAEKTAPQSTVASLESAETMLISRDQTIEQIAEQVRIFPNPTRDGVNLETESKSLAGAQVVLFDATGKSIEEFTLPEIGFEIYRQYLDLRQVVPGTYFLKIKTLDGRDFARKVIVR